MSEMITRIKAYRERLSMSQKELAEKVGVRRETIVRLENGQYNPSLKLAMDISKELFKIKSCAYLKKFRKSNG